ncbi:MAG: DoxX family protein [Rhizobiaceae bacterium]|nr:DoxX family protein [Rhizobiaceae bacterium]
MNNALLLTARILLAFMFVMAGLQKFGDLSGTAGYISSVGLPAGGLLSPLSAIFEVVAGLAILVGFQTRLAAWLLAAFCAFTAFVFHYAPADMMQTLLFTKNLTIAGGFLALSVAGAGAWSLDARRGQAGYAAA